SAPAAAASQLSALESPTQVLPVAAAASHLLHWVVGGVGMLLVGGLALVVWPRGGDADKPAAVAPAGEPKELVAQSTPTPEPKAPAVETDKPTPAATAPAATNSALKTVAADSQPSTSPPVETKPADKKTIVPPAPAPVAELAQPS